MDNARTAPVPLFIRQMVVNAHVAGNVYQLGVVHLHFYLPGSKPEPSVGLLRDLNPFQACKALLEWYGTGRVRWERVIEKLVQLTPEPASEIIQHLTNLRKGTNRMPFEEVVQVAATVLLRSRKSRAFFEALPSGQKDLTLRTARRILHSDPESIRGMVQAITGTDPWLAAQLLPRSGHGEAALALVRALRPMDRMKIMTASPDWTRQFFLTDPVAPLRPLFAEWAREPRSAALIVKALEAHPQRAAVLLEVTSPELIYQVLGSINADGTRAAGILCFMPPSLAARVLSRYPGERELACLKKMPNIPKILAEMGAAHGAAILAAMKAEAAEHLAAMPTNSAICLIDKMEPTAAFDLLGQLPGDHLARVLCFSRIRVIWQTSVALGSAVVRFLQTRGEPKTAKEDRAPGVAAVLTAMRPRRLARPFGAVEGAAACHLLAPAVLSPRGAGRLISALPMRDALPIMSEPAAPRALWIVAMRPRFAVRILCGLAPALCAEVFAQVPISVADRLLLSSAGETISHVLHHARAPHAPGGQASDHKITVSAARQIAIIFSTTPPMAMIKPEHKAAVWAQLDDRERKRLEAFRSVDEAARERGAH